MLNNYQRSQVLDVSLEKAVILLYEGAMKFVHQAKESLESNDMIHAGIKLLQARNIVSTLRNGLDRAQGGELATNLERLYLFLHDELLRAGRDGNPALLDPIIAVLTTLKAAWLEVGQKSNEKTLGEHHACPARQPLFPPGLSPEGQGEQHGLSIKV